MRFKRSSIVVLCRILAIFALGAIVACGGETTTTTGQSAQERLLGWLPAGTTEFIFVDIKAAQSRPELREEVHLRFNRLSSVTGEVFGEELLRAAEIMNGAFGFNRELGRDHEVGILEGDFQQLLAVLEELGAGGTADQLDVEVIEVYRDIEIFTISRRSGRPPEPITVFMGVTDRHKLALAHNLESVKEIIDQYMNTGRAPDPFFGGLQSLVEGSVVPRETEIHRGVVIYGLPSSPYGFPSSPTFYLAVVDRSILVLGFSVEKVKVIIDRIRDGGEAPKFVRVAMSSLGQADFLHVVKVEPSTEDVLNYPLAAVTLRSFAVSFNDGAISTVRSRFSFEEPGQAATAAEWMEAQGNIEGLFFGSNHPVGQARLDGRSILSEATVPDQDVISLLFGDD